MPDTPPPPTMDCEQGTMIMYIQVPLTGDAAMDAVYEQVKHYDLVSIILDEKYEEATFRVEYRPKK